MQHGHTSIAVDTNSEHSITIALSNTSGREFYLGRYFNATNPDFRVDGFCISRMCT